MSPTKRERRELCPAPVLLFMASCVLLWKHFYCRASCENRGISELGTQRIPLSFLFFPR
jgi:hypothetical protein